MGIQIQKLTFMGSFEDLIMLELSFLLTNIYFKIKYVTYGTIFLNSDDFNAFESEFLK
jgi:hypothetical protein